MTHKDLLKEFSDSKTVYLALVKEKGKALVESLVGELFELEPRITKIEWEQYTPYFNDGEPCTFRVYEPSFWSQEKNFDSYTNGYKALGGDKHDRFRTVASTLEHLEDVLLHAFGDHQRVVCLRTDSGFTIETEECEHE